MELFEDIYEWRVDYWDITIDLKPSDMTTTKFSLLSDDAKSFFDSYDPDNSNIWFWDRFNEYTVDILRSRFRLSGKDLKVWTSNGLVWRWAFAAEVKTTLKDWTRASFNELYESMSKKHWEAAKIQKMKSLPPEERVIPVPVPSPEEEEEDIEEE